tara:strand:+ start:1363 stop:1965 length:603 start_codon:yes stop_codon:yes gene_type:complete
MEIKYYALKDIKMAEYNPRQLTKDQYKHLKDSMKKFGLVDPLIINKHKDRKNTLVGGHQRLRIAKELGINEIPCVEVDLDFEEEKELNIRLNKNVGEWDYDTLANYFDVDDLVNWGFKEKEFNDWLDIPDVDEPELIISEELLEEHNYVLFYFDNSLDWNVAQELLKIKSVVKEGYTDTYQQKGVGRVKSGKELLEIINK